jgi:RING finger/CHY zinc finger protein 1
MDLIKEIQKDASLTQEEKNNKIREIMLEQNKRNIEKIKHIECTHYIRNCMIKAKCCGKVYACRLCHDSYEDHPINRFETDTIICKKCDKLQGVSNECTNCGVQFGEYYCETCRLWRQQADIFHCDSCGICNVGIKENYYHCDHCKLCVAKEHVCFNVLNKNCSACQGQIYQSVYHYHKPKCEHLIHTNCLEELLKNDTKCPLCKKTLVDVNWEMADDYILSQPMPDEYKKKVNIKCNDCNATSNDVDYHFLGCKCSQCGSYNTFRT